MALFTRKWAFFFKWREDIYIIRLFWKFTKKGINLEVNIFGSLDIATVPNTDFQTRCQNDGSVWT